MIFEIQLCIVSLMYVWPWKLEYCLLHHFKIWIFYWWSLASEYCVHMTIENLLFFFINLVQCVWPVKFEYCVYDPWNWGILCVAFPLKIESCASPLKFEYRLYDNFKIFMLTWSSKFEYLDSTYRIPWLCTQLFSI